LAFVTVITTGFESAGGAHARFGPEDDPEFDTVTLRCELELLPAASRATAVTV
jgi:hypothetical protein